MNRILVNLLLTEEEAQLLSYGLRNPARLLEGAANNPAVRRRLRGIARRIDENLLPWEPAPEDLD